MNIISKSIKTKCLVALLLLVPLSLTGSVAFANPDPDVDWHYDCFDETETQLQKIVRPNLMVLLDNSGSMGNYIIKFERRTPLRIKVARDALSAIIKQNAANPVVNLGLITFSTDPSLHFSCDATDTESMLRVAESIQVFHGITSTGLAIQSAYLSECHKNLEPNQSFGVVVITDGAPSLPKNALTQVCNHRSEGPVYFVGLGPDADDNINNILAAAGGTGTCGIKGDPCNDSKLFMAFADAVSSSSRRRDNGVAYFTKFAEHCSGTYSAQNTAEFVDAVQDISAKLACNFPLETNPASPVAIPEDPTNEYPYIKLKPINPDNTGTLIPYRYSAAGQQLPPDETWTFANDEKTVAKLGSKACKQMYKPDNAGRTYKEVITHVGCICQQTPGTSCSSSANDPDAICPTTNGTWSCDRGHDVCSGGVSLGTTPVATPKPCTIPGLQGQCKLGTITECVDGVPQCKPISGPMPEVCNGLDDDCDALNDNITHSWNSPQFASDLQNFKDTNPTSYKELYKIACKTENVCVCETETAPLYSMPDGYFCPASLQDYTENWPSRHGDCICFSQ